MKSKIILLIILITFTIGVWSCKDVPPSGTGVVVYVFGTVRDAVSFDPVANASVVLATSNSTDTQYTLTDGKFQFEVDQGNLNDLNATLYVRKTGFISRVMNLNLSNDTSLTILLTTDQSTSAIIMGTVRDSATLYPLRNTTVLLTLPGVVDSTLTPNDGTFRIAADLIDRDSLPVLLTLYKAGYRTRLLAITVYRGQTTNLGDILLGINVGSTVGQVNGRVFDSQTRLPINNVTVTAITNIYTDSVLTTFNGEYSFSINLQGLPSIPGLLRVEKVGYKPQSQTFTVNAGESFSQDFYLVRDTTTGVRDSGGTGLAHSIAFINMTAREISVYGVGGTEASILTWEVRDSLGFPIDIDHRDTVEFEIIGAPLTGGAYVSPSRAITNVSGRVATTVNSGTVSGVIQFVAKLHREIDGVTIVSSPVVITVNAGLPDQNHFSLAAAKINFPAYDWLGRTDAISVQVGDKYSNPVKVNTAVYFNTTGGIINASGFTDRNGQAVVDLHSGNPRPSDPTYGTGFAWVYATTVGESGVTVKDSVLVLFSATSVIGGLSADSFYVPSGGSSDKIYFNVSDRFGNPLAEGTRITVTLQYTPPPNNTRINLVTNGDIDVTLGDTQARGRGTTLFWFQVVDQTEGGFGSRIPATVAIRVTSPNGNPPIVTIPGIIGDP